MNDDAKLAVMRGVLMNSKRWQTRDEIEAILSWIRGAEKHDDEDCGMHMTVTLPESLYQALREHLEAL